MCRREGGSRGGGAVGTVESSVAVVQEMLHYKCA